MPIQKTHYIEDNVLFITGSGQVDSLDDLKGNAKHTVQLLQETGCDRILGDYREVRYNLDTIDVFNQASSDAAILIPAKRYALLLRKENQSDSRFYEDVAHNRGFKVRVFYDYDEAVAWIKE